METERTYFRLCSSCKRELAFQAPYYTCSVSTCNRKRTGLTFCSVSCFEAHVPMIRHREAWAEEQRAPSRDEWLKQQAEEAEEESASAPAAATAEPRRERRIVGVGAPERSVELQEGVPRDILIVVSKLKAYVRARSGMNTSDGAMDVLSDIVRELCDGAIRKAAAEGRKTVMDRDF
jgi:hypothetical protein